MKSRSCSQSVGEEIANSVSHGIACLAAVAVFPILVSAAARRGHAAAIVGASVFAVTMVLMFLASTIYHGLARNRAKRVFRVLDHGAIYLFIAGTYTPFTLGVLRGAWGWTLLGIVWCIAFIGVVLKSVGGVRNATISTWVYLGMGWLILIAIKPLWLQVPKGLFGLVAGGVAYTAGAVIYATNRFKYAHFVWHLFVIMGVVSHFIAVLWYSV